MGKLNDLTACRFGKLVAQKHVSTDRSGAKWECLCDCGGTTVVAASKLRQKKDGTRSCGCLREKFEDVTGNRFGKLVAESYVWVEYTDAYGNHRKARWTCKCDCGGVAFCSVHNLKRGNSTSCGCSRILPDSLAAKRLVLRSYRGGARDRNIAFTLTDNEVFFLLAAPCHYCGLAPSGKLTGRSALRHSDFRYSGIDRKDNTEGYLLENVVSCCRDCNFAKGSRGYEEFLTWLGRVVEFRSIPA